MAIACLISELGNPARRAGPTLGTYVQSSAASDSRSIRFTLGAGRRGSAGQRSPSAARTS